MNRLFVLLSVSLFAWGAEAAPKPTYTATSKALIGNYSLTPRTCVDGDSCADARVFRKAGKLMVELYDFERRDPTFEAIELVEASNGTMTFDWENPIDDDCDNPGCWNLLGISGVIYPQKTSRGYSPLLQIYVRKDYIAPESEDDRDGEVTDMIRLKKLK